MPQDRRRGFTLIPRAVPLPLPVYRDFIDMMFDMRLPILGLGSVYVMVAALAGWEWQDPWFAALAMAGAWVTVGRLWRLSSYRRAKPVTDAAALRVWEQRYARANYVMAALLALLNIRALTYHYPLLHLITVSLVFSFGAGIVARTSIRPRICMINLLVATVPTVVALGVHALSHGEIPLHSQLFAIEALLVAMITGLSLQTVVHLYRSAVEHHTARHDLAKLAKFDALTGLANRLLLREQFLATSDAALDAGEGLAVHYIDLDGFKAINDGHGHPAGDEVLRQVAQRLLTTVRVNDTVARLGGDEFVVLQALVSHESEAELLARRIIRKLSAPYEIDGSAMHISASVGIAMAPELGLDLEQLLSCADTALYRSKAAGKRRLNFCTSEDTGCDQLAVA